MLVETYYEIYFDAKPKMNEMNEAGHTAICIAYEWARVVMSLAHLRIITARPVML